MQTTLSNITATDNVQLPGLLFEPDEPTQRAAVWLHGMGDNGVFYKSNLINALAEALTGAGISLLAFNNRGAHNRKQLKVLDEHSPDEPQMFLGGTHYELIADCVYDINGAAQALQTQGYSELYLLGHSTGANKICVYSYLQPDNPFSKYVLAGPGDDCGLHYQELGDTTFHKALDVARRYIGEGKPHKEMPQYTGMHPFSAQSAADILNPDGLYNVFSYFEVVHKRLGTKQLFTEWASITKPALVICGSEDGSLGSAGTVQRGLEILAENARSPQQAQFETIEGSGHTFTGYEVPFAQGVASWLQ